MITVPTWRDIGSSASCACTQSGLFECCMAINCLDVMAWHDIVGCAVHAVAVHKITRVLSL